MKKKKKIKIADVVIQSVDPAPIPAKHEEPPKTVAVEKKATAAKAHGDVFAGLNGETKILSPLGEGVSTLISTIVVPGKKGVMLDASKAPVYMSPVSGAPTIAPEFAGYYAIPPTEKMAYGDVIVTPEKGGRYSTPYTSDLIPYPGKSLYLKYGALVSPYCAYRRSDVPLTVKMLPRDSKKNDPIKIGDFILRYKIPNAEAHIASTYVFRKNTQFGVPVHQDANYGQKYTVSDIYSYQEADIEGWEPFMGYEPGITIWRICVGVPPPVVFLGKRSISRPLPLP